jgi:hypothetical protein
MDKNTKHLLVKRFTGILPFFVLTVLLLLSFSPSESSAANILVFGDYDSSRNQLAADLTGMGHTVTNVATLPADLTPFDTIWHVSAFTPLSPAEQTQLANFLAAGGGLHLTGDNTGCCAILSASLQTFINSVVAGGGIIVGNQDVDGPYPFNPNALAGVATTPNNLTTWNGSAVSNIGGIGALPDSNILATGLGNIPVGAVWQGSDLVGGGGLLTILMDVNWFEYSGRLPVIQNIEAFLETAEPAQQQVVAVPAYSAWGMVLFSLFAGIGSMIYLQQRKRKS